MCNPFLSGCMLTLSRLQQNVSFNIWLITVSCYSCTELGHLSGSLLRNAGPFHHLTSLTRSEGLHPLEEVLYDVMGTPV